MLSIFNLISKHFRGVFAHLRSPLLQVPEVHEQLAVIIEAIPAQILAGHLAALAGVNGDSFRMDGETEDSKRFLNAHIAHISKL